MFPKDAKPVANSEESDQEQSEVDLHCLLKQTFHWSAIPLRSWQSWSFFKLFQIAAEAWTRSQIGTSTLSVRFHYASARLLLRSHYDNEDPATLSL